jgi:cytochrome P450
MLGLWMAGGQRWKHLRAVAAGPFQLPRLEPFRPRIQALAHELLDVIVPRKDRRIDVVADFARPFYLQVTCLILGLDVLDVPMLTDGSSGRPRQRPSMRWRPRWRRASIPYADR